jgi:hypothetical protein
VASARVHPHTIWALSLWTLDLALSDLLIFMMVIT